MRHGALARLLCRGLTRLCPPIDALLKPSFALDLTFSSVWWALDPCFLSAQLCSTRARQISARSQNRSPLPNPCFRLSSQCSRVPSSAPFALSSSSLRCPLRPVPACPLRPKCDPGSNSHFSADQYVLHTFRFLRGLLTFLVDFTGYVAWACSCDVSRPSHTVNMWGKREGRRGERERRSQSGAFKSTSGTTLRATPPLRDVTKRMTDMSHACLYAHEDAACVVRAERRLHGCARAATLRRPERWLCRVFRQGNCAARRMPSSPLRW